MLAGNVVSKNVLHSSSYEVNVSFMRANKKKCEIVAPKHLNSGVLAISVFLSNSCTMIFLVVLGHCN